MTDEQLEVAARELCRLRRIDPDADGIECTIPRASGEPPIWLKLVAPVELARREIRRHLDLERAIQVGRDA